VGTPFITALAMTNPDLKLSFPIAPLNPEDLDPRKAAKIMYWAGWRVTRIGEVLGVPRGTLFSWKYRDGWDDEESIARVDSTIEARMIMLVAKEGKEGRDYKEIDLLGRQLERTARVKKYMGAVPKSI
jgi:uncharacterized protein YjcR